MDTFTFRPEFDEQAIRKALLIKWEILTLKLNKRIRFFLFIALILLAIAVIKGFTDGEDGPFLLFGILILAIPATLYMGKTHSKRRYKLEINEKIDEIKMNTMNSFYEFSEDLVKYKDNKINVEFKWSAFKGYSIYKNYILLMLDDKFISFYLFGSTDEHDPELEKILDFTKAKLPFKKIK